MVTHTLRSFTWLVTLLLVGAMGTLSACAKKDSRRSSVSVTGYAPGCPGCTNVPGGNVLAAAIASRNDGNQNLELGIRIHAASSGLNPWSYYGPVTTSGYLAVQAGSFNGCAVLPPGLYSIRSIQANGSFAPDTSFQPWNLMDHEFEVVHPNGFAARVRINYAEFFDQTIVVGQDGSQFPHRLYGELRITPLIQVPTCYFGPVNLFFPRPF